VQQVLGYNTRATPIMHTTRLPRQLRSPTHSTNDTYSSNICPGIKQHLREN